MLGLWALLLASCSGLHVEVCQQVRVGITYDDDHRGNLAGDACRIYEIRDAESP